MNHILLRATLERAADTLEQLQAVLHSNFAAETQVAELRAAAHALANNATPLMSGASPCDGQELPARWRAMPAKPTKQMLLEAHATLGVAGHTVTFETLKALYECFLAEAPSMLAAEKSAGAEALTAHLAPYSG